MNKTLCHIEKTLNTLLALMFLAMFGVVLLQVFSRYVSFIAMPWTEELTRLAFVYIIALGSPLAIKYDDYARVDLLVEVFPLKARLLLELFVFFLVLCFVVYMSFISWDLIRLGMRQKSIYLRIPMYFAYFAIPLSFILTSIASIIKIHERVKDYLNPQRVTLRKLEEDERNREENAEHEKLIEEAASSENRG